MSVNRRVVIKSGAAACMSLGYSIPGLRARPARRQLGTLSEDLDRIVEQHGTHDMGGLAFAIAGERVFERYWNGSEQTAWDLRSAGKSVSACLVGIARDLGAPLELDRTLPELLPEFEHRAREDSRIARMTLHDLLAMKSGFDADADVSNRPGNEEIWDEMPDWLDYFLTVPMATEPGARFAYTSLNTALVGLAVARAAGTSMNSLFEERLAVPLGFGQHRWRQGPHDDAVAQGNLFLRVRDVLAFGEMVRQAGISGGQRVVPESWLARTTAMVTPLENPPYVGYGLQWWRGQITANNRIVGFPFASGNGGQKCFVVPDLQLTVAATSTAFGQGRGHARAHALFEAVAAYAAAER